MSGRIDKRDYITIASEGAKVQRSTNISINLL
jgi:hypothetical protein